MLLCKHTFTGLFLITSLNGLTGCTSLMPTSPTADALAAVGGSQESLSVDEMLNRARGEQPLNNAPSMAAGRPASHLLLTFTDEELALNDDQKKQLNSFANARPAQQLSIECAPSSHSSVVTAASQAIARCLKVSEFLQRRAHTTQASLMPSLETNHVFIKDAQYTALPHN